MYTFTQLEIHNNRHFYPLFCGCQACSPSYSFGPAMREYHLFHFCLEGKGQFFAGNVCHRIQKGQGFLICPGDLTFYQADEKEPWTYLWIAVEGDMVKHHLSLCGLSPETPVIACPYVQELRDIILDMLEHYDADYSNELYNQGLLYQFFSYLAKSPGVYKPSEQHTESQYIAKAIEFIKVNYQSPITVQQIADYVSLNRCYLSTLFQKNVHFSPQQFLKKYRITKASELLANTDHLIRNIAFSCGYTSELAFTKAFRQVTSLNPSEYRRRNKLTSRTICTKNPHEDDTY